MTDFDKAIEFVLLREGPRSELPHDPGGLTIWGISMRAHPAEVQILDGLSSEEARESVKAVYFKYYWRPSGCEQMTWPLSLVAFDTAVNCGRSRLMRFIKGVGNGNWRGLLCNRMRWQLHESRSRYTRGLINRMCELYLEATS